MTLTFLGTGTSKGIPVIGSNNEVCLSTDILDKRLRTSALVSCNGVRVVIDCGPDFRAQMLRENVSKIEAIIYTHEHADHTAGLDDIRPYTQAFGDLPIYAHKRVMQNLEKRFDYIFETERKYPSAPGIIPNIIENNTFQIKNLSVTPIEGLHGNLQIFGYRFNKLAYLTDFSYIPDIEKQKLQNLEVLVINALRLKKHPTHFNLDDALELIEELQPKRAFITHISHKLGFHKQVEKQLPKHVFLAYDGLKITI
jgi:phosphoribosyl 1,2-cyclic phosphate phosphodiesterase